MANRIIWILAIIFMSCRNNEKQTDDLVSQQGNKKLFTPGLGEFMTQIQIHHAKLWFAGQSQNWALAAFEINEIVESLDDAETFCSDRPEIKSIGMIRAPVDSVQASITIKSGDAFTKAYILMTKTCNDCHQLTSHGFNVIKIPDQPPFSNQEFKPG